MILKIRAANNLTDESWRYFDGVRGLHYNVYDAGLYAQKRGEIDDYPMVEGVQRVQYWDDGLPPYKVALLCFDSDTTGPIEITCNTKCFLMAESGKTIERII